MEIQRHDATTLVVAGIACVLAADRVSDQQRSSRGGAPHHGRGASGQVSASIATDHGPNGLIIAQDGVYVGNHRGGSIQRIDPATNRVVSTCSLAVSSTCPSQRTRPFRCGSVRMWTVCCTRSTCPSAGSRHGARQL